jgi:serine phosphatase RsbU (regulator of sigma subunit)
LDRGDLLVLYTDGIIEARRDGEFFGEQRLHELVEGSDGRVEQLPARILAEVLAFSGGSLKDDAAVLAISLVDAHARPDVAAMARQGTLQV